LSYIAEAAWAKEHGLASSLEEYDRLPAWVHEDARMMAAIEGEIIMKQRRDAARKGGRS